MAGPPGRRAALISFDFSAVLAEWPLLARGVATTMGLTAVSATLGVALGVACAWARTHGGPVLRAVVSTYVELIRNTPFIVQLFFLFFGLPSLGLRLSPELASVLAMVINLGAYAAEIVRAGIATTPRGQIEAAQSLALTEAQVFLRVVLPPALQRVWPALVSQIVIVMLGSAVCGQISTARALVRRQPDPVAQLPRLRGLHRRHAALPGPVHGAAAAAELAGPALHLRALSRTASGHGRFQPLGHLSQPAAGSALDGGTVADRLRRRRRGRAGAAGRPHRQAAGRRVAGGGLRAAVPGHAAADAALPGLFRAGAVRHQRVALGRGGAGAHACTAAPSSPRSGAAASTPCPRASGRPRRPWR